jgi:hypothetical protein
MYTGIDNPFKKNLPDTCEWHFTSNNGSLFTDGDTLYFIPSKPGNIRVNVFSVQNYDTLFFGFNSFKVMHLHQASVFIDSINLNEVNYLNKGLFYKTPDFLISMGSDLPKSYNWYSIQSVTLSYSTRGNYKSVIFKKPNLEQNVSNLLVEIPSGTELIIRFKLQSNSGLSVSKSPEFNLTLL